MEITNGMLAMKMIEEAHSNLGGCVQLFVSYCGSLPACTAANNSLATNSGLVLLIFYPKIDETRMVSRQRPHFGAQWILSIARDCNALNYTTRSI
jgi:hypothetical protein